MNPQEYIVQLPNGQGAGSFTVPREFGIHPEAFLTKHYNRRLKKRLDRGGIQIEENKRDAVILRLRKKLAAKKEK